MSLQGTFDTLSVTELFGLLSTAAKTGALRLEAGEHEAAVFVRAGRCCGVESPGVGDDGGDEVALAARLVDIGFTLARQPSGAFRFTDVDSPPRASGVEVALEPAVAEIVAMLDAWHEIEATIPSLDARLRLAPVLRSAEIVLRPDEWRLLVGLERMPSVRELVAERGEPLIDVCRMVKDLVDRGAVEVGVDLGRADPAPPVHPDEPAPPVRRVEPLGDRRSALEAATASILEAAEPYAPEAVEPEAVPVPVPVAPSAMPEPIAVPAPVGARIAADPASDEPADRGALLRLFSALKE